MAENSRFAHVSVRFFKMIFCCLSDCLIILSFPFLILQNINPAASNRWRSRPISPSLSTLRPHFTLLRNVSTTSDTSTTSYEFRPAAVNRWKLRFRGRDETVSRKSLGRKRASPTIGPRERPSLTRILRRLRAVSRKPKWRGRNGCEERRRWIKKKPSSNSESSKSGTRSHAWGCLSRCIMGRLHWILRGSHLT